MRYLIIFLISFTVIFAISRCQTTKDIHRLKEMYPGCEVNDRAELICPVVNEQSEL